MDDLRQLLDLTPVLACSKDLEGRYRAASPGWLRAFGLREEEVVGRTDLELFPHDLARQVMEHDRAAVQGDGVLAVDETHLVRGEVRVMRVWRTALRDGLGRVVAVGGRLLDVTDERSARRAVQDAQRRYEAALDRVATVHVAFDLGSGATVEANANAERFFGRPRAEIFRMTPWILSPAEQPDGSPSKETAMAYLREAAETGECAFDWVHQHADGSPLPCRITLLSQRLGDRRLVQASILDLREVSERARQDAWEQEAAERVQALNQLAGWELEAGQALRWTAAAQHLFPELGPPATLEQALERFQPEARARMMAVLNGATSEGRGFDLQVQLLGPEATWVRLLGTTRAEGGGYRVFGTAQDIGARRMLEEQLLQAQKLEGVGRLAGGVAHDFNNVLTVILGSAEMLGPEVPTSRGQADLEAIRTAAVHAQALTAQLLAFARRKPGHPTRLAVDDAVRDAARLLERLLGEDVRFQLQPGARDAVVHVDRTQLEQVLVNLTVNARDAMPGGGRLVVRTARRRRALAEEAAEPPEGPYVVVEVEDTGEGMDAEGIERAFEPFFTTKPVGQGTGLGLSTVHGIAHQWGGTVGIDSELGVGTTVRVWIPEVLTAATVEAPETPDRQVAARSVCRVLVVEDEASVREVTRRILARGGFDVEVAEGAEAALAILSTDVQLDVMVSDVVMPGVNGLALRDQALALRPELPVLFVSGYAAEALRARGLEVSEIDLMSKPYRPDALVERVRSLVGGGREPS